MSFHTANPARFSYLSPRPEEQANKTSSDAERGWRIAPFLRRTRLSNRAAIAANFRSQCADDNFALGRLCRYVSVFCSVTASGPFRRPAALGLLLRILRPLRGLGSSQNKFENHGKERLSHFFRAPPRKQTFGTWEPGPLAKLRPV
jgi:hypothetical protein